MVLQWLVDNQPEDFLRTSETMWMLMNCWLNRLPEDSSDILDLPDVCQHLPALVVISEHYVEYIKAHHADDPVDKQLDKVCLKLLTTVLCTRGMIMTIIFSYAKQLKQTSIWDEFLSSPSLLDAALTDLAGVARYKHKQHTARQEGMEMGSSSSSSSGERGSNGTSSGSSSISRGSSRGGRGSSNSNSRAKTVAAGIPTIVGASSLAQLLQPPDHELVTVAGGKLAIGVLAQRYEGLFKATAGTQSPPVMTLPLKVIWAYASAPNSSSSSSSSPPSGAAATSVVALQLLLELAALVGQDEHADADMESLGHAWDMAFRAAPLEERQAFLSTRGPLLLQVMWLLAEQGSKRPMRKKWLSHWPLLLNGVCSPDGTGISRILWSAGGERTLVWLWHMLFSNPWAN